MRRFVLFATLLTLTPVAALAETSFRSESSFSLSTTRSATGAGGSVSGSSSYVCIGTHCEYRSTSVVTIQCTGTPENGECDVTWDGSTPDLIIEVYPDGTTVERKP